MSIANIAMEILSIKFYALDSLSHGSFNFYFHVFYTSYITEK